MNTETETILDGGGRAEDLERPAVGVQELAPEHQANDHTAAAVVLPPVEQASPTLLMPDEKVKFERCKKDIRDGMEVFLNVGLALSAIRDGRLYRESHDTFEGWCLAEYGWSSHRARQLIRGAEVVRNLQAAGSGNNWSAFVMPASEGQARPLLRLPPEEQRSAWEEAVQSAPGGRVTAAHVEGVVLARRVKLGLQEPAPGPAKARAAEGPIVDVQQVPDKQQKLREFADQAIAAVRAFQAELGTPDSRLTGLTPIIDALQDCKDHLPNVERMQAARSSGARVGTKAGHS
jgi:hypothetical protein